MWDNNIKFNDSIDNKQAKISKKKKKQTLPNPQKPQFWQKNKIKKKVKSIFFIRFHFGTLQLIEHHG